MIYYAVAIALLLVAIIEGSWGIISRVLFGNDDNEPPSGFA